MYLIDQPEPSHVLQRHGAKRWPPGFFYPGCVCCGQKYTVRKYANDSSFNVEWSYLGGTLADDVFESGGKVYAAYTKATSSNNVGARLNSDASIDQNYDTTDAVETPLNTSPTALDSSGNWYRLLSHSTGYDVGKWSTTGTKSSFAANDGLTSELMRGLAIDSSDNVYGLSTSGIFGTTQNLYKWNSAGTKQWRTTLSTSESGYWNIWVDTGGSIWVIGQTSAYRVDSSGSIATTITPTQSIQAGCSDNGTGCYVRTNATAAWNEIRQYDSGGSLVASWDEAQILSGTQGVIATSPDGYVYAIVRTSGSLRQVRKYDSTGAVQWTSGDVGFGSVPIYRMTATNSYVYIAGQKIP